jgi:hypothetical protein
MHENIIGVQMRTLLAIAISLAASCIAGTAGTYKPTFVVDYGQCSTLTDPDPILKNDGNTVEFGKDSDCHAGRVVSTKRYINITKIRATIDLSKVKQDFVNATFYLIENDTFPSKQPKGQDGYCDDGGSQEFSHPEWNCREIDFLETNGNKITQTTLHLHDYRSSNPPIQVPPQRYEYAFAATSQLDANCFNYSAMLAAPQPPQAPTNGYHSLVNKIDLTKPFEIEVIFTYGNAPGLKASFKQVGDSTKRDAVLRQQVKQTEAHTVEVYNTNVGTGAQGSDQFKSADYKELIRTMGKGSTDGQKPDRENGYWLLASFWSAEGGIPLGPEVDGKRWWNPNASCNYCSASCPNGELCNSFGYYWSLSDVEVTAEKELGPGQ